MNLPQPVGLNQAQERMRHALEVAATTPAADVPVAAVIYGPDGEVLSTAVNRREADGDPTAHAEVLALRAAAKIYGDGWRLGGCEIVVTLEPCTMCAGAILGARLSSVVFGAFEPKTGACGSLVDVLRAPGVRPAPQVRGGVLEEQCAGLLTDFFQAHRAPEAEK